MLGYNTYHMKTTFENDRKGRGDFALWQKMENGTATSDDIDKLFAGYDAALDFFTCSHIKLLLAKYPDAKVIYCSRDPEKWRQVRCFCGFCFVSYSRTI